jgi:hypothetical protein
MPGGRAPMPSPSVSARVPEVARMSGPGSRADVLAMTNLGAEPDISQQVMNRGVSVNGPEEAQRSSRLCRSLAYIILPVSAVPLRIE